MPTNDPTALDLANAVQLAEQDQIAATYWVDRPIPAWIGDHGRIHHEPTHRDIDVLTLTHALVGVTEHHDGRVDIDIALRADPDAVDITTAEQVVYDLTACIARARELRHDQIAATRH